MGVAGRGGKGVAWFVVVGICVHILFLFTNPGVNLGWKLNALAQWSHDTMAGTSGHVLPRERRGKKQTVLAIEANRQFEIVSVENPLHSVYVKCCRESSSDTDFVCTCTDEEAEKLMRLQVTPVSEIEVLAAEVIREMNAIEQTRDEIFENPYTQYKWFVENSQNLPMIQDAIFGPQRVEYDKDVEHAGNFKTFEKKFQAWCEDRVTKGIIEVRFNSTNEIREEIYRRTRCEADEYDLGNGCARKNTKMGRATNNGILEAEQAEKEKALAKMRSRYDSPVELRAESKVDEIEEELRRLHEGTEEGDSGDEGSAPVAESDQEGGGEATSLEDLFGRLDAIRDAKVGQDFTVRVGSCLSARKMDFIENFVSTMLEDMKSDKKARLKVEEQKLKKQAETKRKADEAKAEAKRKSEDAKRKERQRRRDRENLRRSKARASAATNATPAPTAGTGPAEDQSNAALVVPVPPPPPQPQTNHTSPGRTQRRSKRSRNRQRERESSESRPAPPPTPPAPVRARVQNSSNRRLAREKRLLQKKVRQEEEGCHSIYQSSLKDILQASQSKKIHTDLVSAETDKQSCIRRARRRYEVDLANLGNIHGDDEV
ncbi:hypothetical protein HOP50_02g10270 [Chloropicon primus]|nr:hypothetical protein HOP50_02g10270 [Chloropicon primus]